MQAFSQIFNVIFNSKCRSMLRSSKHYPSPNLVPCLRAQFSPPKIGIHVPKNAWTHNAQGRPVQEIVCIFYASLACNEGRQVELQLCGQRWMSSCALGLSALNLATKFSTQSGLAAFVTQVVSISME